MNSTLPRMMVRRFTLLIQLALLTVLMISTTLRAQDEELIPLAVPGGTTAITGSAHDATSGLPLSDAEVTVNGQRVGTTDASGKFAVYLPLDEEYQMADIIVSKAGYASWTMTQTALYPGVTRKLDPVALGSAPVTVKGGVNPDETLYTPEDLAARASLHRNIPKDPKAYLPQGRDDVVSHFEIPLTITVGITPFVHCHEWIQDGKPITEVVEMDMKEYIKNVLPNEWVSTWHPQSLMAGAMAAKMYAWYKIVIPSYHPEGVDVVDNTCDQVFFPNSHRDTTDAAVDATWHYRMSRNNRVIEIHYLARDWQCEDQPTWECMGQWESKDKADAGWDWQSILKFYYDPVDINVTTTIEPDVNLVLNGGFESDASQWTQWGGIEGANVVDGVFQFYRKAGSNNPATIYQDYNLRVPKDTTMMVKLTLGNSSTTSKTIRVHLHRPETWTGAQTCEFVIPPGLPMQKYAMYVQNPAGWVGMRLEIQGMTADDAPAYLLDGVKLKYRTKGKAFDVPACAAPMPGRPTVYNPVEDGTYGKHTIVTLFEGESNLRPGYSPAYHVQISRTESFSSMVFDNLANPSEEQNIRVTLGDGQYYLRARQFDGVDRYSRFTKPVSFNVIVLPGKPVLTAPVGTVDAVTAFTWTDGGDATSFKLKVEDVAVDAVIAKVSLTADEVTCTAGVCTVEPAALGIDPAGFVPDRSYTWKAIAKNANGKAKSESATFVME
jgi:hypothetical protein